jgi:hypothetical protein
MHEEGRSSARRQVPSRRLVALGLVVAMGATGCFSYERRVETGAPRRVPGEPAVAKIRLTEPTIDAEVSVTDEFVEIRAETYTTCTTRTTYARERDETTVVESPSGAAGGVLGTIVAVGLTGLGAGVMASPCSLVEGSCSERAERRNFGAGVVSLAGGIGIGVATVVHGIMSMDESTTVKAEPEVLTAKSYRCDVSKVDNKDVSLRFGQVNFEGRTDDEGVFRLPLRELQKGQDRSPESRGVLTVAGEETNVRIDISRTAAFRDWKRKHGEALASKEQTQRELQNETDRQKFMSIVAEVEAFAEGIRPAAWTDQQLKDYPEMVQAVELASKAREVAHLRDEDMKRIAALAKRLDGLGGSHSANVKAREARLEGQRRAMIARASATAVPLARRIILSNLLAPASARFSGEKVLAACGSGVAYVKADVDSQNGFGALVRKTLCAAVHTPTRRGTVYECGTPPVRTRTETAAFFDQDRDKAGALFSLAVSISESNACELEKDGNPAEKVDSWAVAE